MSPHNTISRNENLQVALALAAIGIPVFPCDHHKRPLVKWKAGATTDPREIERLWRRWPTALPAFPTGEASGLALLDLDRKDGKDGFAALAALGIDPATLSPLIAETASGGWHVYFTHVPGLRCSVGQAKDGLAGVDVRAERGFAIAPGAVGPKGRYYFLTGSLKSNLTLLSLVGAPVWPAALPVQPRHAPEGATGAAEPSGLPLAALRDALMALPLDVREADFGTDLAWFKVARIIFDETGGSEEGRDLWHEWSGGWGGYDYHVAEDKWNRSDEYRGQRATVWTILNPALAAGWSHADLTAWRAMQGAEDAAADFPDDTPMPAGAVTMEARIAALVGDPEDDAPIPAGAVAVAEGRGLIVRGDRIVANQHNVTQMLNLNLDSILPDLHRNMMTGRDEWRGGEVTDNDIINARAALDRLGVERVPKEMVHDAVSVIAEYHQRHPIRDALALLKHDGQRRLDTWLIRHAGAEDSPFVRFVSRAFLIQMVARVMQPGCKADYTLVLFGPQGQNKSAVGKVLAGAEYFSDTLPSISGRNDRDTREHLTGMWLIEKAELAASRKSEAEDLKAFLTATTDRVRLAYGRRTISLPRQCVFMGTTNEEEFLNDATGGRRFWPVAVRQVIDVAALAEERDQLFAEAVEAYQAGEPWWPDHAFEAAHARPAQEAARLSDSWTDTIATWLDSPETDFDGTATERDSVTISDVLSGALAMSSGQHTMAVQKRAANVMRGLGWIRVHSKRGKVWKRPDQ